MASSIVHNKSNTTSYELQAIQLQVMDSLFLVQVFVVQVPVLPSLEGAHGERLPYEYSFPYVNMNGDQQKLSHWRFSC